MEEKQKFGQFISQKRKENNMTQREFAAKLFVTESAVSKWERGLSYPDISLVSAICTELKITEHELITASEDHMQRQFEKQAKGYQNIVKTYEWIWGLLYAVSLTVCFIVNLALSHGLTWFFIVLTAEMTAASFLNVPVLVKERKGVWTVVTSFISIMLLLLSCSIFTKANASPFIIAAMSVLCGYVLVFLPYLLKEFLKPVGIGDHKGLICMLADTVLIYLLVILCCTLCGFASLITPILLVTVCIVLPWIIFAVVRYLPFNKYLKTAACLFCASVYTAVYSGFINMILEKKSFTMQAVNISVWNNTYTSGNIHLILILTMAVLAVIFTGAGVKQQKM